jgi:hypothetical protein
MEKFGIFLSKNSKVILGSEVSQLEFREYMVRIFVAVVEDITIFFTRFVLLFIIAACTSKRPHIPCRIVGMYAYESENLN